MEEAQEGRRLLVWSPDGVLPDLPAPFVPVAAPVPVPPDTPLLLLPSPAWRSYAEAVAGGMDEPDRVVLYKVAGTPLPLDADALADEVVEAGDADALALALEARPFAPDTEGLSEEDLEELLAGRIPPTLSPAAAAAIGGDPALAAAWRRSAALELALRGRPRPRSEPARVAAEIPPMPGALPVAIAALVLVGWVRAGMRPRSALGLRSTEGPGTLPDPADVAEDLADGIALPAELAGRALTFEYRQGNGGSEGAVLRVTTGGDAIEVRVREGETVVWTGQSTDRLDVPLALLEGGSPRRVELVSAETGGPAGGGAER